MCYYLPMFSLSHGLQAFLFGGFCQVPVSGTGRCWVPRCPGWHKLFSGTVSQMSELLSGVLQCCLGVGLHPSQRTSHQSCLCGLGIVSLLPRQTENCAVRISILAGVCVGGGSRFELWGILISSWRQDAQEKRTLHTETLPRTPGDGQRYTEIFTKSQNIMTQPLS